MAIAPDRLAVVMAGSGGVTTYREFDRRSATVAAAPYGIGPRKGDVIALVSDNALPAFKIYWAALRSGLYITDVNRHLSADEAAHVVNDIGAQLLFASAGVAELASDLVTLTPAIGHRYAFGGPAGGRRASNPACSISTSTSSVIRWPACWRVRCLC